jgi:pimeloyl-ACP methyl ester carboxylesterase
MTQLLDFGQNAANATAAAQQLCLIVTLYRDRPDLAQQLLDGQGELVVFRHQPDSWPPSWGVFRSGTDRYFVVFAGTTNAIQWVAHAAGSFGRIQGTQPGEYWENGQWRTAYEALKADLRAALPSDLTTAVVHFSGHSYGGALAFLAAEEYQPLALRVETLTFGSPKVWDTRYPKKVPDRSWRWQSWSDSVVRLPSGAEYPVAAPWTVLLNWQPYFIAWEHQGNEVWIAADGTFPTGGTTPSPLPVGVANGPITEHLTRNYWGRLNAYYQTIPPDAAFAEALGLTDTALAGPDGQTLAPELPRIVPGPIGEPELIPFFDGVPPRPVSGGLPVAVYPTPLTGGRAMDIVLFYNSKGNGWTENYVLYVASPAAAPYDLAKDWVVQYAALRRPVLSVDAILAGVRISDQAVAGDSLRKVAPDLGMGVGLATGNAGNPNDGWQATFLDVTNTVRAQHPFRGFPDIDLGSVMKLGALIGPGTVRVLTFFNNLRVLSTAPFTQINHGTGALAIRALPKDPATWITKQWTTVSVDANGFITVRLTPTTNVFQISDKVYISHPRKRCVHGLSGVARVTAVADQQTYTLVTLDKRPCCPGEFYNGLFGQITVKTKAYYAVSDINVTRASYRDTGRPIGSSRGRRAAGCC